MRLRNIKGSRETIVDSPYVMNNPGELKGKWTQQFNNVNPIQIEIGMGKGKFLHTLAKQNPKINYIGIEKYSSVLLRALQKMEEEELPNLLFLRMDAEEITDVFEKEEIDRIYLNFSDPWPKDRHAKRRLPSHQFLERYHQILVQDGLIEFKTDNRPLFDFAVEEVKESPFIIKQITYDLHHEENMMEGNIMTEYEEKFSSLGNPICKYILTRTV